MHNKPQKNSMNEQRKERKSEVHTYTSNIYRLFGAESACTMDADF